jgi:hypothetical protein
MGGSYCAKLAASRSAAQSVHQAFQSIGGLPKESVTGGQKESGRWWPRGVDRVIKPPNPWIGLLRRPDILNSNATAYDCPLLVVVFHNAVHRVTPLGRSFK